MDPEIGSAESVCGRAEGRRPKKLRCMSINLFQEVPMIYLIDPKEAGNKKCIPFCSLLCGIKPLYGVPPVYCYTVE